MKPGKIILSLIIILFSLINVVIQSFNWVDFNFLECGYYTWNPNCNGVSDLLLNKFARSILLIIMIVIIEKLGVNKFNQNIRFPVLVLLAIEFIDIFLIFGNTFLIKKMHEFFHPLAFSPVLPVMWLLIRIYFKPTDD